MGKTLGFVGLGVSGFALLFSILAITLNDWQSGEVPGGTKYGGLWKICREVQDTKKCIDIDSDSVSADELKSYKTVRAMVMLGIFLSTGAMVAGILVMFVLKGQKLLYILAAGLDIAAGLSLMTGMAIYAGKLYDTDSDYDLQAAFVLDVVAWIAAWVAGGIFIGAKNMDED